MGVLIIEPSRDLSLVISAAFARQKIKTNIAHSAQQAIKLADKQTPKAVVLEVLMHQHNGLEFIYEFRSYYEWLNIPIVIYTNLSRDELHISENLAKDMGVKAHLYKPTTSLESLVSKVQGLI